MIHYSPLFFGKHFNKENLLQQIIQKIIKYFQEFPIDCSSILSSNWKVVSIREESYRYRLTNMDGVETYHTTPNDVVYWARKNIA